MIKSHVLVRFEKDWADEFDVVGFYVCPKEEWDSQISILTNKKTGEWYFGTNEGFEPGDININDYQITELTEEEACFITKSFGTNDWGHFPMPGDNVE